MHQKINVAPKTWPIERKNKKFVVVSTHLQKQGIPLLVAMRDILHAVANRRELKITLRDGKIKVNNKIIKEDKFPLALMSVLSFGDKNYRVIMNEKRKFSFDEINAEDANELTFKVIGKKILRKGKKQFNLLGGHNITSDKEINVGDSVVLDLEKNDIKKILKLERGSHVLVISGRHLGKIGVIKGINNKMTNIDGKDIHFNVNSDNIMSI